MKYSTWPRSYNFLAERACPGLELLGFLVLADTSLFGFPSTSLLILRTGHPKRTLLVLGSWLLPLLLCPSGLCAGWEVFSWGDWREEARHGDLGVGWRFLRCTLSNSFHSGLVPGVQEGKLPGLLFSVLLFRYTLLVVISVAQPPSYRFQSLNTKYAIGGLEPESGLSRPGPESDPCVNLGFSGEQLPWIPP